MNGVVDSVLVQKVKYLLLDTVEEVPMCAANLAPRNELGILKYLGLDLGCERHVEACLGFVGNSINQAVYEALAKAGDECARGLLARTFKNLRKPCLAPSPQGCSSHGDDAHRARCRPRGVLREPCDGTTAAWGGGTAAAHDLRFGQECRPQRGAHFNNGRCCEHCQWCEDGPSHKAIGPRLFGRERLITVQLDLSLALSQPFRAELLSAVRVYSGQGVVTNVRVPVPPLGVADGSINVGCWVRT